jgi:hypothetical protein
MSGTVGRFSRCTRTHRATTHTSLSRIFLFRDLGLSPRVHVPVHCIQILRPLVLQPSMGSRVELKVPVGQREPMGRGAGQSRSRPAKWLSGSQRDPSFPSLLPTSSLLPHPPCPRSFCITTTPGPHVYILFSSSRCGAVVVVTAPSQLMTDDWPLSPHAPLRIALCPTDTSLPSHPVPRMPISCVGRWVWSGLYLSQRTPRGVVSAAKPLRSVTDP